MAQHDPNKMTDDELFENWAGWITRTAEEFTEVFQHRQLFNSIRAMFDHNPKLHTDSGQFVMDWQARLYGRDVLLFIRREFDYQNGTENILHLLREMQRRPQILSRARYYAFFNPLKWKDDKERKRFADSFFNTFKIIGDGTSDTDYLDPAGIEDESRTLQAGIETVLLFANRNLAHRTPEWNPPPIIVPKDTDAALFAVQALFDKLYPLLTGKSMSDLTPAIQFDWEDAFRHVWMSPKVADAMNAAEQAAREAQAQAALDDIKNRGGKTQ